MNRLGIEQLNRSSQESSYQTLPTSAGGDKIKINLKDKIAIKSTKLLNNLNGQDDLNGIE